MSCRLTAVTASEPRLTDALVHTVLPGRTADRVECSGRTVWRCYFSDGKSFSVPTVVNGNHAEVTRTKYVLFDWGRSINTHASGRHVASEAERVGW